MADTVEDKHTIFIVGLGPVNVEQLNAAIESFLRAYSVKLRKPREFWGKWYINLIASKGVAFVFFDKSPAYYVMAGLNIDGEDFYEEVSNPEYEEWEKSEEDFLNKPLDLSSSISWSDASDTPPKTIRTLVDGPLVEFPAIKLDPTQIKICNIKEVKPKILQCKASFPPEDLDKDTLFACNVPSDITEKDIVDLFKRFVTSTTFKVPKVTIVKQKNIFRVSASDEDYKASIQKYKKDLYNNKIFVKFDSNTNDALFALQMTMKCKIKGKDITFKHSKRTKFRETKPLYTHEDALRSMYFG